MPLQPVILPEPLYLQDAPDDMEEFWKMVEELNVIRSDNISFNRYPSPWQNRCPVELRKRRSVVGKPKYAVTYFKHVYLLSSLEALIQFVRNPRPFLKLEYLEPTCRVVVVGTLLSGKSMISQCLSWIFDALLIDFKKLLDDVRSRKHETISASIFSEIMPIIEDKRLGKWQSIELERLQSLNGWYDMTQKNLKKYIPMFEDLLMHEEDPEESVLAKMNALKNALSYLPFLDDIGFCKTALYNKDVLLEYAPADMTTVTESPTTPVIYDSDVVEAISEYIIANDLQKDIEPTPEEMIAELSLMLAECDEHKKQTSNGDHLYGNWVIDGFPSDPDYWGILGDYHYLPDYTIAIYENRELDNEIIEFYKNNLNTYKNHEERFMLANDPLLKIKLMTKPVSNTKTLDMQIICDNIVNNSYNTLIQNNADTQGSLGDFSAKFNESLEKFREDWDNVKIKLEDNAKAIIELEIADKTDIQLMEEALLKLRLSYYAVCVPNEDNEIDDQEGEDENPKDVTFNDPRFLSSTSTYCPISYFDYGVLWEGKSEYSIKYDNRTLYFSKEEYTEIFQKDPNKYQIFKKPLMLPSLKICVIGGVGSGKSSVAKSIAKELGLIHIDFVEFINDFLIPRHFKRVGRNYENPFKDEPLDDENVLDFQADEENPNLETELLANETEIRRMVFNYFERGSPMLSSLMQKIIKGIWFQEPFSSTGFVIDNFPRLPTDVEEMIACSCIPDLVIELESSSELALLRMSSKMFKTWKMQMIEAKKLSQENFNDTKKTWMEFVTKQVVVKVILEDILQEIISDFEETARNDLSGDSIIIDADPLGLANVDANLFKAYSEITDLHPEPVYESEWEKPDEVRERIDSRLESIFDSDDENIQALKDVLSDQKVKIYSMDASKPLHKVLRRIFSKLNNYKNRNQSFFEQTYVLNSDVAEILLLEGFYFLSKFNRMCPVFIHENPNAIQNPYKLFKRKGQCYAVLHRCYMYFICNEENLRKFRNDPIFYISDKNIEEFIEFPMSIAVIGPPKSGKSSLVAKLAKKYGLLPLSRGTAIRNTIEHYSWTKLGSDILSNLYTGEHVTLYQIILAVKLSLMDHRSKTNGFIFDGFPDTAAEALQLSKEGIYPIMIFELKCTKTKTLNNLKEDHLEILKIIPHYSTSYMANRYEKWMANSRAVPEWIQQDYNNLYTIHANDSSWQSLQDVQTQITSIIPKIHYYLTNVKDKPVPVGVICISNESINQRMSKYKNFCPVCFANNKLKHSDFPVDKKGVIHYQNVFYWVCPCHIKVFLSKPDNYLNNKDEVNIPEIPAVLKTVNKVLVYENGVCIVTYAENLPSQIIKRGDSTFAAGYKGRTYMFCSNDCLRKFLEKPQLYADIVIFKELKLLPQISLKNLPHLGYLEQTVGDVLTEACCQVNVMRPKYPGLDIQKSALLFIALYLKTHNPLTNSRTLATFCKSYRTYEARCKLITDVGLVLRSMDNPFARYPKCCRAGFYSIDSGTDMKPSRITPSATNFSTGFLPEFINKF